MPVMGRQVEVFFSSYNVTATTGYVYDSTGASNDTAGAINGDYDHIIVQICVATLNAGSCSYRIEGKYETIERWANVFCETVISAHSIDKLVNIVEKPKELRIGVKVSNDASPNNFHAGAILTESY